ncbi:MAG: hypothetical protein AAFY88_23905, partial [Acidobacteriota bacterium]
MAPTIQKDKAQRDRYILALRTAVELAYFEDADILFRAGNALYEQEQFGIAAKALARAAILMKGATGQASTSEYEAREAASRAFSQLGFGEDAAERYFVTEDDYWAPEWSFNSDESYFKEDRRAILQLTFAGPRFEEGLANFFAYWQAVDVESLDLQVRAADPCVPKE